MEFRWPSSHELENEKKLASSSLEFAEKIEFISQYVSKNYERFHVQQLKESTICKDSAEANTWKQKGNDAFAKKQWEESIKCYSEVRTIIDTK